LRKNCNKKRKGGTIHSHVIEIREKKKSEKMAAARKRGKLFPLDGRLEGRGMLRVISLHYLLDVRKKKKGE